VTKAVERLALSQIKDKSFWDEIEYIGNLSFDSPIELQSKELERIHPKKGYESQYEPETVPSENRSQKREVFA